MDRIDYLEWPTKDINATKAFFKEVFGWEFTDYGPDYCDFRNDNINGGFYSSEIVSDYKNGSALVVFYSDQLEETQERVKNAGGSIAKEIFSFPGGRRFHFKEPGGNELAVWTDK